VTHHGANAGGNAALEGRYPAMKLPRLAELSAASRTVFVQALDGVYEHSPWVAEQAWNARPFATLEHLSAALTAAVAAADRSAQLELIRAHPALAGRAAVRGELTELSRHEQQGVGLDRCSPEEFAHLTSLNEEYKAKFGFPFIIAVAGHTRAGIIEALERRLHNSADEEFRENLRQIERIAAIRLRDRILGGGTDQAAAGMQETTAKK
jgi:2-oxo-4-hydroxy-4-carboxy-5-ureidoimidazoline decarboxylase